MRERWWGKRITIATGNVCERETVGSIFRISMKFNLIIIILNFFSHLFLRFHDKNRGWWWALNDKRIFLLNVKIIVATKILHFLRVSSKP